MTTSKKFKEDTKSLSGVDYNKVRAKAESERLATLNKLNSEGKAWEEDDEPPAEDITVKHGMYPSQEEIAAVAASLQRNWDKKEKRKRAGALAAQRVELEAVKENKGAPRGSRREDY